MTPLSAPDDVLDEIISFLSFNDVMKSLRRVNKEHHQRVSLYYLHYPLTSFDRDNGHWSLLPFLRYEEEYVWKNPEPIPIGDWLVDRYRSAYGRWEKTDTLKTTEAVWPLHWLQKFFGQIARIDLTSMSLRITDLGLCHLYCMVWNTGQKILHLSLDCSQLSSHSAKYLKFFLEQGLESLVAKNISFDLFASVITDLIKPMKLKFLDLSENSWLEWSDLVPLLHFVPDLQYLDLSKTKVGAAEEIDFSQLECRASLRDLNLTGVFGFLQANEEHILSSCHLLNKK